MTNEKVLMVLHGLRMSYICDPNECPLEEKDESHILCKGCDEHHEALAMAIEALEKQSEIVHCGQCEHWVEMEFNGFDKPMTACALAGYMIGEDGFCVYGTERDEE